ncbi:putative Ran-binding protein 6 [Paratrimastix pyriformis]|uniref:Ran-binding protein 6 n=1 Tax=Paratrimastix pyriformis TaxID=342808 RepID=A0ABQ8UEQ8_9EUKA|nr:putative Ran-binding protein 6 [Paratrimastix pyriformis]
MQGQLDENNERAPVIAEWMSSLWFLRSMWIRRIRQPRQGQTPEAKKVGCFPGYRFPLRKEPSERVPMDLAQFEQLCRNSQLKENEPRVAAEGVLLKFRDEFPDQYCTYMMHVARNSAEDTNRSFAAVMLRTAFLQTDSIASIYYSLTPPVQASLKADALQAVQEEKNKSIFRKFCDLVGVMGSAILCAERGGQWPELLPWLFECTKSPAALMREGALDTFSQIAMLLGPQLKSYLRVFFDVLSAALVDPQSAQVRLAAVKAASSFLLCCDQKEELTVFQPLIPLMLRTISDALTAGQEDSARTALEALIDVVDGPPPLRGRHSRVWCWKCSPPSCGPTCREIIQGMLSIADTATLEPGTRHLALEFLITVAENAAGMARKAPGYVQNTFQVIIKMMLELNEDPTWGQTPPREETGPLQSLRSTASPHDSLTARILISGGPQDTDELMNADFGCRSLDRFALALKGKTVLPVAMPVVQQFLQSPDWKYRHTALMAIALIGEGCKKMIKEEQQAHLVAMIQPAFQDPHPRVRWASVNAIGQMCNDFSPDFQRRFHAQVMPALARLMSEKEYPLIQQHAASATINFTEECRAETITPYLNDCLQVLYDQLLSPMQAVREQAITAVASMADTAGRQFTPYFEHFMGFLKQVFTLPSFEGKEHRMFKAKTMECITLIGLAVGKETFAPHSQEILQVLYQFQTSHPEDDDPRVGYWHQAWCRVCKIMGPDFGPYLEFVIPPLLETASLEPKIKVQDADDPDTSEMAGLSTFIIDDKRVGIQTTVLEEKTTAVKMLGCYVAQLRGKFYAYVVPAAKAMVPLVKQRTFEGEYRVNAIQAVPDLVMCINEGAPDPAQRQAALHGLVEYVLPELMAATNDEADLEVLGQIVKAAFEVIKGAGPNFFDGDNLMKIGAWIKTLHHDCVARRAKRNELRHDEDFDEEQGEKLDEENEHEEDFMAQLAELTGCLIQGHHEAFLPAFQQLSLPWSQLLQAECNDSDHQAAICVFDDVIEFCGEGGAALIPTLLPVLITYSNSEDPHVRQASVYGVGQCARFGGAAFPPHQQVSQLEHLACDNAIASLGRICQYQVATMDVRPILPVWLHLLPIVGDVVEGRMQHAFLCDLIDQGHPAICTPGNVAKICQIFAILIKLPVAPAPGAAAPVVDPADQALSTRMVAILKNLQKNTPPDVLQAAWAALTEEQRQKLAALQ